jgi:putative cell wall-binding protein
MRRRNRIAAVLLAGTLCLSAMPTYAIADDTQESTVNEAFAGKVNNSYQYATFDINDGSWLRRGGNNRYDTMEAVVQATFEQSDYAVLVTGEYYADALLANGLAGTIKCPVILTTPGSLSPQAERELTRLAVKSIYIIGNTNAVSTAIEADLVAHQYNVMRIAGGSEQETSAMVLEACRKAGSPSENVIIATSKNFPDALSIGPWAYATGSPILFTDAAGMLTDAQVAALKNDSKIKHALVIGGDSAVSDAVANQLTSNIEGWRIGGKDRYDTSAKVADWCVTHGGLTYANPVLTTATNFPDALCGAALAAKSKSVLLVADRLSDVTIERLRKNASSNHGGYILGGEKVIAFDNPLVDPKAEEDAGAVREGLELAAKGGQATEDGQAIAGSSEEVESFR